MVECCIFDLDGTLLYTLDSITYHLNKTLSSEGYGEITVDDTKTFIGDGARLLVKRALEKNGVMDDEVLNRVLKKYNKAYNDDPIPYTEYYEGILELVDSLVASGVKLCVVTNKPEVTARQLVAHFLPDRFSLVYGGRDGAILKPDPSDTLRAIHELGVEVKKTAFIGDTSVDIKTAKNAGVGISVGVSWGFRERDELVNAGADFVADAPLDIIPELEKI